MSALSNLYKQHAEAIEAIVDANGIPEGYELETARMDTNPSDELEWNKQGVAQLSQFRRYFHRLIPIVKMPEPKPSDSFSIAGITPVTVTPLGLSHRDQLAMNCPFQFLQNQIVSIDTLGDLVERAYQYADLMIAESKKEQHEPA